MGKNNSERSSRRSASRSSRESHPQIDSNLGLVPSKAGHRHIRAGDSPVGFFEEIRSRMNLDRVGRIRRPGQFRKKAPLGGRP